MPAPGGGARFRVVHSIGYRLARPAGAAQLTLRLTPRQSPSQRVEHHQVVIEPRPPEISSRDDDHGNAVRELSLGPFAALEITAISTVTLTPPELGAASRAALDELLGRAGVERAPAREARAGLCHERSERALAALRQVGVPCRYLSGYALPPAGGRTLPHAWLSLEAPGIGRIEYDPTLAAPAERHLLLASGETGADVAPVTGPLLADGAYRLVSRVEVEKLE